MLAWMRSFGQLRRVGVEATGTYGAGLLRYLQNAGAEVLEVTTPDSGDRRKRGKNDDLDAQNAAHAAFAGKRTVTPKTRDGMIESLRVLKACRKTAVAARRVALQMIHNTVVCAPDELRDTLRKLTRMELIRTLAAWRPDMTDYRNVASAYRIALKSLSCRYLELHDEIADLDAMIAAIVDELAPALVTRNSIGYASAAQLLLTAGDNSDTLRREPGPSLFRQDNAPSPQPWRRQGSQQRTTHHRHRTASHRPPHQELYRKAYRRGPFQARGHSVPQALHRARDLLPHQPKKTGDQSGADRHLTNRRASAAHSTPAKATGRCWQSTASRARWDGAAIPMTTPRQKAS